MSRNDNPEQEEAIQADLKRGEKFCLCVDCRDARERLRAAGFKTCLVACEVLGVPEPVGVFTVGRNDTEAKERAAAIIRRQGVETLIIPGAVEWNP